MKSEILFRGKTEDGEWLYGELFLYSNTKRSIFYNTKISIFCNSENVDTDDVYIIPETVGAFTGLRALNYERIFEGDILRSLTGKYILVTDSGYGSWTFIDIQDGEVCRGVNAEMLSCCRIIDNIHDNPDFVETYQIRF